MYVLINSELNYIVDKKFQKIHIVYVIKIFIFIFIINHTSLKRL
jgi:hypothetical protein